MASFRVRLVGGLDVEYDDQPGRAAAWYVDEYGALIVVEDFEVEGRRQTTTFNVAAWVAVTDESYPGRAHTAPSPR